MKRTPPEVSKARQQIGQEIALWKEKAEKTDLDPQQAEFCRAQLVECRKRMHALLGKSKKRFWAFKD